MFNYYSICDGTDYHIYFDFKRGKYDIYFFTATINTLLEPLGLVNHVTFLQQGNDIILIWISPKTKNTIYMTENIGRVLGLSDGQIINYIQKVNMQTRHISKPTTPSNCVVISKGIYCWEKTTNGRWG